jgi:hypothetical protein
MDFDKALNESLDGMWNNRQYGGASELPRKDYQPYSTSTGYGFPYQKGAPPISPPTSPQPENTPEIPWPLQNVTDDIADSFVYLLAALKKMEACLLENPSLKKKQRAKLKQYIRYTRGALARMQKVGMEIIHATNLAGDLPPQVPDNTQRTVDIS